MKYTSYPNKQTIRLSDKQDSYIKRKSKEFNISEADFIRILIDYYIINEKEKENENKNGLRFNNQL